MDIKTKLTIEPVWIGEQSDDFSCGCCGGEFTKSHLDMYRLYFLVFRDSFELPMIKTNTALCEYCYNVLKK